MKTVHTASPGSTAHYRPAIGDWLGSAVQRLHVARRPRRDKEPTVQYIVDQIMDTAGGGQCEVRLDPRITRIEQMKWLLPICVQQLGSQIEIDEQPAGDQVVLIISVIANTRYPAHQGAARRNDMSIHADMAEAVA
ncbi:MAG TPA: hypothetical protein VFZ66_06330 [Herpetosiphonaceae bacterium]